MNYDVIDIEGVGESYAKKLHGVDINTTEELLQFCSTPANRRNLSEATGISPKLILKWTNHADLFRIKGVGPQFAELLEASGVDTVKELRHRKAENLATRLAEVNDARHLTRRVPSVTEVQKMIDEAANLEPVIKY